MNRFLCIRFFSFLIILIDVNTIIVNIIIMFNYNNRTFWWQLKSRLNCTIIIHLLNSACRFFLCYKITRNLSILALRLFQLFLQNLMFWCNFILLLISFIAMLFTSRTRNLTNFNINRRYETSGSFRWMYLIFFRWFFNNLNLSLIENFLCNQTCFLNSVFSFWMYFPSLFIGWFNSNFNLLFMWLSFRDTVKSNRLTRCSFLQLLK